MFRPQPHQSNTAPSLQNSGGAEQFQLTRHKKALCAAARRRNLLAIRIASPFLAITLLAITGAEVAFGNNMALALTSIAQGICFFLVAYLVWLKRPAIRRSATQLSWLAALILLLPQYNDIMMGGRDYLVIFLISLLGVNLVFHFAKRAALVATSLALACLLSIAWKAVGQPAALAGEVLGLMCLLFPWYSLRDKAFAASIQLRIKNAALKREVRLRQSNEELMSQIALRDSLTGLPNRRLLIERLELEIVHARRDGATLAILFCDLDFFKKANDLFGHVAGDWLLTQVASRLQSLVRISDTVARYGGDEFVLILPDAGNEDTVRKKAEELIQAISQPYIFNDNIIHIGMSVGISLSGVDGYSCVELLEKADIAMYVSKQQVNQAVSFFADEMIAQKRSRLRLEADLRDAIERDSIETYFQPIYDLQTGEITVVEALARWTHADREISPEEFVRLAEESGLIYSFGLRIINRAMAGFARLRQSLPERCRLAINISPLQLAERNIAQAIDLALTIHDLPASLIEIEITENDLIANAGHAHGQLLALRERGVGVAIDDFGKGYSSLSYLTQLPIDRIKIDRTFVRDLPRPSSSAVLLAVTRLAESLGIHTVAEGVETEEQLTFLKDAGCGSVQGYFCCRPLSEGSLRMMLVSPIN